VFRVLQKGLIDSEHIVSKLCDENSSTLLYLIDQSKVKEAGVGEEMHVDETEVS